MRRAAGLDHEGNTIPLTKIYKGGMLMNTWVILVEMAVFAAIFTTVVFAYYRGDRKIGRAHV